MDAEARVALAKRSMKQKDLKTACAYADAAAESGAGWAYVCAAECRLMMGDFEGGADHVRELSQHYPGSEYTLVFLVPLDRSRRPDRRPQAGFEVGHPVRGR